MRRSAIYVRVSTDDQTDFSPDAQEKRCRELARLRSLTDVVVFTDEGWSGKNLERPAAREMLALVEAGDIGSVVVWRWDRLTRDTGDGSRLTKLFVDHEVTVYSVNEGELNLTSASGRMQIGVHGVFAQFYRDSLIENTKMGQRQAAESGRWINHAPTGYTMVNKFLQPNDDASLVTRVFDLRASGWGYQAIADDVGFTYSTVQHICHNRVYLGETRLRDEWFDGHHAPLVSLEQFNAAQRGHTPGKRRSKDLLSGKVRCGICGRVAGVRYNDRNQAMYLCRNRGAGCRQPGRSAKGLHRAARLGFKVLGADADLQAAIRLELSQQPSGGPARARTRTASIKAMRERQKRLLDLYIDGYIPGPQFAVENDELNHQITTLELEGKQEDVDRSNRVAAASAFESMADLLAMRDFGDLWDAATEGELRTLTNDLLDSVNFYPDEMTVQVVGAPPIRVDYDEVGLRPGSKPVVSEAGLEPARP
jgi:site-specific DNA recombinase